MRQTGGSREKGVGRREGPSVDDTVCCSLSARNPAFSFHRISPGKPLRKRQELPQGTIAWEAGKAMPAVSQKAVPVRRLTTAVNRNGNLTAYIVTQMEDCVNTLRSRGNGRKVRVRYDSGTAASTDFDTAVPPGHGLKADNCLRIRGKQSRINSDARASAGSPESGDRRNCTGRKVKEGLTLMTVKPETSEKTEEEGVLHCVRLPLVQNIPQHSATELSGEEAGTGTASGSSRNTCVKLTEDHVERCSGTALPDLPEKSGEQSLCLDDSF